MKKFLFREVRKYKGVRDWGAGIEVEEDVYAPPHFMAGLAFERMHGRRAKELRALEVIDEDGTKRRYRHYVFEVKYESFFNDRSDGIRTKRCEIDALNTDDALSIIEVDFNGRHSRLISVKLKEIEYGF